MREKHEFEKGVICERCLKMALKGEYTRIQYSRSVVDDTTGATKIFSRMNLCNDCFNEYKNLIESFIGRIFKENVDARTNLEYLKQLRDQMLNIDVLENNQKKDKKIVYEFFYEITSFLYWNIK